MKNRKLIVGGALAAVLIGAISVYEIVKPGPPVTVVKVSPGVIRAAVHDRAITSLPEIARLTMPFDARVEPITIEPGTSVKKGQIVARLDTTELDAEVEAARAQLAAVDAQLAVLADNAIETILLAELGEWIIAMDKVNAAAAQLIEANAANAAFTDWWKSAEEKLKNQGAVADEKYRRAKVESSQASVDLAVARLDLQLVEVMQKITQLGPKYVHQYLKRKGLQERVLEQNRAAAQARLEIAEYQRARAEIRAPADGVVLERLIESERDLSAGTVLLTIGQPDQLRVRVDLLSDDAGQVKVGDAAEISGAVLGDLSLQGQVVRVDPFAFTKVSSLGVDQQRVTVIIDFADGEVDRLRQAGRRLGVAFRVQARVFTDRRDNALSVPRLALLRGDDGGWQVYRAIEGKAVLSSVTLGIGNAREVQITKGLSADDLVLVSPPKDLVAGAKVSPRMRAAAGEGAQSS